MGQSRAPFAAQHGRDQGMSQEADSIGVPPLWPCTCQCYDHSPLQASKGRTTQGLLRDVPAHHDGSLKRWELQNSVHNTLWSRNQVTMSIVFRQKA